MRMFVIFSICMWFCDLTAAAPPKVELRTYLQFEGITGKDASLFVKIFEARERGDALRLGEALLQYYAKATGKEALTEPLLLTLVFPAADEDGELARPFCYKVLREARLVGTDEFMMRFERSSSQPTGTATAVGIAWERIDGRDSLVVFRETFHLKEDSWISVDIDMTQVLEYRQ